MKRLSTKASLTVLIVGIYTLLGIGAVALIRFGTPASATSRTVHNAPYYNIDDYEVFGLMNGVMLARVVGDSLLTAPVPNGSLLLVPKTKSDVVAPDST